MILYVNNNRNSISTLSDGVKPIDEKDSRGSKEGSVPINATGLNHDQRQSSRWDNDGIDSGISLFKFKLFKNPSLTFKLLLKKRMMTKKRWMERKQCFSS